MCIWGVLNTIQFKIFTENAREVARIYGGEDTTKNEYPCIVAILGLDVITDPDEPLITVCAGTIITNNTILTAASCFYNS